MSYCRWSSNDFQCDVYVYMSDEGFMIHVANLRYVFKEPLPEPVDLMKDTEGFVKRITKVMAMLDSDNMVKIGLPYDGKTFIEPDAEFAAERLIMLKKMGYRVPDYAIEALQQEGKEEPNGEEIQQLSEENAERDPTRK